jgi:ubiquinone/menaquinone biosynthesis C-methylase UbiE
MERDGAARILSRSTLHIHLASVFIRINSIYIQAMLRFLSVRRHQPEMMDEPNADRCGLLKALSYIRFFNRLLGYGRLIVAQLNRFSAGWKPGETIRILDVGTGSADIPLAILKWAAAKNLDVRIIGLDLHPIICAEAAKAAATHPKLNIVRGDAVRLPFDDRSFDYAVTSMFLHHLGEDQAVNVLQEMDRVSRRGIIASDLLRLRRSYFFVALTTLFASKMVRHDAKVSIEQAFTKDEILALCDRAGVSYADYSRHLTHRFVLAGEKVVVG